MYEIYEIKENKKKYLDLLLLADEQEDMIDRYLERGTMFILDDNGVKAVCVITKEKDKTIEIKNIAVNPEYHRNGYGKAMIEYVIKRYKNNYDILQVGTGDSPLTVPFYKKCGFTESHRIKNFFTENYNHPIYECGILLKDMVYFKLNFKNTEE